MGREAQLSTDELRMKQERIPVRRMSVTSLVTDRDVHGGSGTMYRFILDASLLDILDQPDAVLALLQRQMDKITGYLVTT